MDFSYTKYFIQFSFSCKRVVEQRGLISDLSTLNNKKNKNGINIKGIAQPSFVLSLALSLSLYTRVRLSQALCLKHTSLNTWVQVKNSAIKLITFCVQKCADLTVLLRILENTKQNKTLEMSHRVLVIGSGGREHAICWKLNQSAQVSQIYALPGSIGISQLSKCQNLCADVLDAKDFGVSPALSMNAVLVTFGICYCVFILICETLL